MIYTLSLILKDKKLKRIEKNFSKKNKVLNQKEIYELLNDFKHSLPIFESAVASHKPVDGVPYYTFPPIYGSFAGHDNFRKAAIAEGVGLNKDQISKEDLPQVYSILDSLSPLNKGNARTKILAWNSLGKVGTVYPEVFEKEEGRVREALNLSKDINATSYLDNSNHLGATLFLEPLLNTSNQGQVENLLQDVLLNSDSIGAKAMLTYLSKVNGLKLEKIVPFSCLENSLVEFYNQLKPMNFFNSEEISKGHQLCGIVSKGDLPLWPNTLHEKYINRTISAARSYSSALGAFSQKNYKDFVRRD